MGRPLTPRCSSGLAPPPPPSCTLAPERAGVPGGRRAGGKGGAPSAPTAACTRSSVLDPCRPPSPLPRGAPALTADPTRASRRSPPPGAPPGPRFRAAPRLGRRLAADLELVRTRGIRLFN